MEYNTQNHWAYESCPMPKILNNQKTAFRKVDLFPASNDGRETLILTGPRTSD
jgi:hypothetical protein